MRGLSAQRERAPLRRAAVSALQRARWPCARGNRGTALRELRPAASGSRAPPPERERQRCTQNGTQSQRIVGCEPAARLCFCVFCCVCSERCGSGHGGSPAAKARGFLRVPCHPGRAQFAAAALCRLFFLFLLLVLLLLLFAPSSPLASVGPNSALGAHATGSQLVFERRRRRRRRRGRRSRILVLLFGLGQCRRRRRQRQRRPLLPFRLQRPALSFRHAAPLACRIRLVQRARQARGTRATATPCAAVCSSQRRLQQVKPRASTLRSAHGQLPCRERPSHSPLTRFDAFWLCRRVTRPVSIVVSPSASYNAESIFASQFINWQSKRAKKTWEDRGKVEENNFAFCLWLFW